MAWLLIPITILAGIANAVQSGTNTTLNKSLQEPILAALVVTAASTMVYLLAACFVGISWPGSDRLAQVPWWGWLGGFLGGFYVLAVIIMAEKLGAAVFTGIAVTAAIVTSVALDHFGLVGFKEHAAGLWRIVGCILMIGGLVLVSVF